MYLKKYVELIKNFGFLTISNFGSKLLAFILVPLYTSVLTTEEYGNYDFINTTISLLIPLLTIDISGAALRFLLDKKSNKKSIISYSLLLTIISIFIVFFGLIINHYFSLIRIIDDYAMFFLIFYISSLIYTTLQNVARGLDKLKSIAIVGFINSVLVLTLNILFLLKFELGLNGYFLAYIISNFISSIYLILDCKIYSYISFTSSDKTLISKMNKYSFPLMFNSIGWWVNNVSDRYMVTYMISSSANGVYSLAYKIPSLLSIIQSIFNQAWTISAVKSADEKEKANYYSNIYSLYNFFLIMSSSLLIIFTKILALLLYKNEFYEAWQYMPLLIISNLFGALSGLLGGVFSATKDSKTMGRTTIIGSVINIIINYVLIQKIGIMGAAIGTFVSFFAVWVMRYIKVSNSIKLSKNLFLDFTCYFILMVQLSLFYINIDSINMYIIELFLLIILLILNYRTIKDNKDKILKIIKSKGKSK